ncbi:MAG: ABC transporter permease [Candidatus Krumholzibacteriia bacterium]
MRRVRAMALKEVAHILRDPRSLALTLLMPLMMVLLFGYAIDMELEELPLAVLDLDRTPESRGLVRDLTASRYIVVDHHLDGRDQIEPGFRSGTFRAALVIPRRFAARLAGDGAGDGESRVQLLVDGADGTTAATVDNYVTAAVAVANRRLQQEAGLQTAPAVDTRLRIWFNPELESSHFVVPGLVAVVLVMICALLTSVALTREKETGTLEQVLTTPVSPLQVITGKLLPYLVIGAVDAALVLLVGRLVFDVPMAGSFLVLAAYSLVFILIALALGLLISAVSATQRVAMMLALVVTYLPSLLLSGFIFELESMPVSLRWLAQTVPATHYIQVLHGVMLKGQSWFPAETAIMLAMLVVLMTAAVRRFGTTLD